MHHRRLDVTGQADWQAAIPEAKQAPDGLNALFNNAGIVGAGSVTDTNPKDFRRTLEINLTGAYLGIHLSAPAIRRAGGGVIVNTSSTAGLQGYGGLAAYMSRKWGLRGLTRAAALDLAPDNIRVLSLHPGPIRTPMTEDMPEDSTPAQPVARYGTPSGRRPHGPLHALRGRVPDGQRIHRGRRRADRAGPRARTARPPRAFILPQIRWG